jgi:hypothetical protein
MFKLIPFIKKLSLVTLVLAIGLTAMPSFAASAAGLQDPTPPPPSQTANYPRLERAWAHAQNLYQREGDRLAKADAFITKAQSLIDKATQKGWDTSAVQTALDTFAAVIPAAKAAHEPGAAIIASHNGFDASGKVTDRVTAIATLKALHQVLKDTHTAMNGTGVALRDAVKTFRDAHRPTP